MNTDTDSYEGTANCFTFQIFHPSKTVAAMAIG